ncbi:hypothetical protein MKW98_018291 [Papaver atlanticum]|uniref:Uncharacterized protein n=1 Tax=Papaver atlanticum TaxID=357466 RepID=A0AAD4T6B7_9MAGN|nr:hypothetical protein MKW98_018291 [Papaver atlanticum]
MVPCKVKRSSYHFAIRVSWFELRSFAIQFSWLGFTGFEFRSGSHVKLNSYQHSCNFELAIEIPNQC